MQFLHVPYVGLWVGGVSNVQLAQGQERNFSGQVHFVELHEYFGAHLIRLHNVVKQPEDTRGTKTHSQNEKRGRGMRVNGFTTTATLFKKCYPTRVGNIFINTRSKQ